MSVPRHILCLDEPYHRFVEPMGTLAIVFAKADSALFWLIAMILEGGERAALTKLGKDASQAAVEDLLRNGALTNELLSKALGNIEIFYRAKQDRNLYVHAEWYAIFDEYPEVGVGLRKQPRKAPKKPDQIAYEHSEADIDKLWEIINTFCFCREEFDALRFALCKDMSNADAEEAG